MYTLYLSSGSRKTVAMIFGVERVECASLDLGGSGYLHWVYGRNGSLLGSIFAGNDWEIR